jgi:2-polyprenyl-3-methyl-5-hydroxy-6-metoxy-1,4-benzoquinol methylase
MLERTPMSNIESKIVDYWNQQPCNIKHSKHEVGTEEYFNEVSAKRYRVEPHILDFAGFHLWRGRRVLEIGCGIGSDAEQFARHGADYVGIDISDESINLCRRRFRVQDVHGEFHRGSVTDLEFLKHLGKFDLVYSYGVLHHFPSMDQHLANIAKVLEPGGELRFMVYARNSWKYAMIQKGLDQFEAQADCPYAEAYTKEEITELLQPIYHVERIRQDHCFMYNVPKYKQGDFELEPWFEAMPEVMRIAVKEYLGWHLLIKAKKL